jgi:hypothetical protein
MAGSRGGHVRRAGDLRWARRVPGRSRHPDMHDDEPRGNRDFPDVRRQCAAIDPVPWFGCVSASSRSGPHTGLMAHPLCVARLRARSTRRIAERYPESSHRSARRVASRSPSPPVTRVPSSAQRFRPMMGF